MTWKKVDTSALFPSELKDVGKAFETANEGVTATLKTILELTALVDKYAAVEINPKAALIRATLQAAAASLAAISNTQVGMHFLSVRPAPISGAVSRATPIAPDLNKLQLGALSQYAGPGGNYGFFKTVADALNDAGDFARPTYGPTDYVAGVVLLAGSDSPSEALDILMKLSRLLGSSAGTLDGNFLQPPQNLGFHLVPATPGPLGVRLYWDPRLPTISADYGVANAFVKQVVIYRSLTPLNVYSSPTTLAEYEYARLTYSPLNNSFTDKEVEDGKTYYYAAGFTYEIIDTRGDRRLFRDTVVSHVVQVPLIFRPRKVGISARGIPPDWVSLRAGIDMFPRIQAVIGTLSNYIAALEHSYRLDTGLARLTATLRLTIERKQQLILEMSKHFEDLAHLFTPIAGVYALSFSGKGGNRFFVDSLLAALSDKSDPNRPPFDKGTELVGGCVILGGGPTLDALAGVTAFSGLFTTVKARSVTADPSWLLGREVSVPPP
jgi:hypothetical protein